MSGGDGSQGTGPPGDAPRSHAGGEGNGDDIEESLHEALSDLEQMLQRHEGARGERERPTPPDDSEQYTIPLLDDVVIPGVAVPPREAADAPPRNDAPDADDEATLRRRLAARLASEVEVIVQDRMEAALEKARAEIAAQVRNHMDITLPEIVDELAQLRRRDE